jgi:hypothetical protein
VAAKPVSGRADTDTLERGVGRLRCPTSGGGEKTVREAGEL